MLPVTDNIAGHRVVHDKVEGRDLEVVVGEVQMPNLECKKFG